MWVHTANSRIPVRNGWHPSGCCHTVQLVVQGSLARPGIHTSADGIDVILDLPGMRLPRPLADLQATNQVTLDCKAPLQLGGPTGQVAEDPASPETAFLPHAPRASPLDVLLVPPLCL